MHNKNNKVFVAVSGGVDSSVALSLLQEQGYDVTGVYFKTYKPDGNREYCRQQGMDAQEVCKQLGVPFKVFDLQEEYKQKVFEYMIKGYESGHTPNPDIMCNKEIKFGVFAKEAFAQGADYIATGHYARVDSGVLLKAIDENKDQSYFLSQITQEVLSKTLFPIGEYKKHEVREIAKRRGLCTASKKDSQGICFIGQEVDVKGFLKKYIKEERGDVLNLSGDVIGIHAGSKFSTIGERHGFTILPEYQTPEMPRLFVIHRDIDNNTITVGTLAELEKEEKENLVVKLERVQWINNPPKKDREYKCRIRHRGALYSCTFDEVSIVANFIEAPYALASGQYLAVYDGDECLGGGVMV